MGREHAGSTRGAGAGRVAGPPGRGTSGVSAAAGRAGARRGQGGGRPAKAEAPVCYGNAWVPAGRAPRLPGSQPKRSPPLKLPHPHVPGGPRGLDLRSSHPLPPSRMWLAGARGSAGPFACPGGPGRSPLVAQPPRGSSSATGTMGMLLLGLWARSQEGFCKDPPRSL